MKKLRDDYYQKRWNTSLAEWMLYVLHRGEGPYKGRITWMGQLVHKNPVDMWVLQEIIFAVKPQVIVEIGSEVGGSTLYFAHLLDIIGEGKVISIDISRTYFKAKHPQIIVLTGDSSSPEVIKETHRLCKNKRVLINHDGDHHTEQVFKDLNAYSDLVSLGSYFTIEDGAVDIYEPEDLKIPMHGSGPLPAIREFLKTHPEFIIDNSAERYIATLYPQGFLKRIK